MKSKKTSEKKLKKSRPRVSVIIPTYNSWSTLGECITSIQRQTLQPLEIIVVDNASTDETQEKISKLKPQIPRLRYFKNKKNLGVTGGRNRGIKEADINSDYLFFFDHDMVAEPQMLKGLVKMIESNSWVGIVTPKIYYWEDKKKIWAAGTGINLWNGYIIFRGGEERGQYDRVEEVQVAPAAMLVKREVLNKLKGFDDIYFATYEDTDFCFRAKRQGYRTIYAPSAFAYHRIPLDSAESNKRLLERAYWVGRNRVIFMKRFGKNFLIFLFFVPFFSIYYLFLAIRYGMPFSGFEFIKGTLSGLTTK